MTRHTLLLLRHAKSSWDEPALDDFDRPLAKRGREAASQLGRELARRGWAPDMAIVSPALRTRQTWDLIAVELPSVSEVLHDATIYEARPDAIRSVVRGVAERIKTLLVLGHNPGLQSLALEVSGPGGNQQAEARLKIKYPTSGLCAFTFGKTWAELDENTCRLVDFIAPRKPK